MQRTESAHITDALRRKQVIAAERAAYLVGFSATGMPGFAASPIRSCSSSITWVTSSSTS
jgi:hypothetical protein